MRQLEECLPCGISIETYWNSTQAAIVLMMKAHKKREQYEMQKQASLLYTHADLIGISVSRLFGDNKMPDFKTAFGYLFENEVPEESESVQMDAELETSKMRLMQYIDRYNQAREREVRGNDE